MIVAIWEGTELPYDGDRPYVPPKQKGGGRKPKRRAGGGFVDDDNNVWIKAKAQHGGPHWDVQHRDLSHTNVDFHGRVRGGDRRSKFPNSARQNEATDNVSPDPISENEETDET